MVSRPGGYRCGHPCQACRTSGDFHHDRAKSRPLINGSHFKRSNMTGTGERTTGRRFKGILDLGLAEEYDIVHVQIYRVKAQVYRDSSFGLDGVHNTIRHLYVDAKSRRNESSGRMTGRDYLVSTESVACCNYNRDQHASRGISNVC